MMMVVHCEDGRAFDLHPGVEHLLHQLRVVRRVDPELLVLDRAARGHDLRLLS